MLFLIEWLGGAIPSFVIFLQMIKYLVMIQKITLNVFLVVLILATTTTSSLAQMSKKILKESTLPPIENKDGEPELLPFKDRLLLLIEKEAIFLDPEVSNKSIAKLLLTSSDVVENVILEDLGKTFEDFINAKRVKVAIEKIDASTYGDKDDFEYILEGIARDVGFRSKSQLVRNFKKFKETTPEIYAGLEEGDATEEE